VDVQNISEAMVVSECHQAGMSWVIQIVDAQTLSEVMVVFEHAKARMS
jgi:hypothetical protein